MRQSAILLSPKKYFAERIFVNSGLVWLCQKFIKFSGISYFVPITYKRSRAYLILENISAYSSEYFSPIDVVTNKDGRLEITVVGYPAKYTKFRNATKEDVELVKEGYKVIVNKGIDLDNPSNVVFTEKTIEK